MSYLVSLHIPCLPFTFSSVPADTIRFTPGRHGDDDGTGIRWMTDHGKRL